VYFEDAEGDPHPTILNNSKEWSWDSVKRFFETHVKDFEVALINGSGN